MSDEPRDSRLQVGRDPGFFKSIDGVFKGVQLVLSLLLIIFLSASSYSTIPGAGFVAFANFAACFNFITLIISGVIYFFKLYNFPPLTRLPWGKVELYYALGSAVSHFIGMILTAITASNYDHDGLFVASAILSVLVMIAFLAFAFIIFRGKDPRSVQSPPIDSV